MITARINDEHVYNVVNWDPTSFSVSLQLNIASIDLNQIKDDFYRVSKLVIMQENNVLAIYTSLDTFSEITYVGTIYDDLSHGFYDCVRVTMTKANIVDQVNRLDEQINPVVDPSSMTIDELKNYKLKQISEACEQDVYDGTVVTLPDGTQETFTYSMQDQENTFSLLSLLLVCPAMDALPWHSSGHSCRMYTRAELITICSTLLMRKTQLITYANALNMYVNSISDRNELMNVEYGMELPQSYADNIAAIMGMTIEEMQKFMEQISGNTPTDESAEPVVNDENTEETN